MYQAHQNFRKQVLQFQEQLHGGAYAPQVPQHVAMPLTPMDYAYSHSMLPANLLSTPSPYVSHPAFGQAHQPPPSPFMGTFPGSSGSFGGNSAGLYPDSRSHSSTMLLPYSSQQQLQQQQSSLEHLNFSRTVVLTGLSAHLGLRDILDAIDHGPIESVALYDLPLAEEPSSAESSQAPLKECSLSFVNTHISYHFHHKYAKNAQNMKLLREQLQDSANLKILAAESARTSPPGRKTSAASDDSDVIKVKTLNYIMEFNATRSVGISFCILDSDLVPLMEKAFRARCSKFGQVEDLVMTEDDDSQELEFFVHFTSIDSAISLYEYYSARVESENLGSSHPDDARDDLVQLSCQYVTFQRDRCDRTALVHARRPFQAPNVPKSESGSVVSAVSGPLEMKPVANANETRSSSRSTSQVSSGVSDLPLNFKALDMNSEQKLSEQDLATGATSEHSDDGVDPKRAFVDPSGLAEPGEINFNSEAFDPVSPSIEPVDYFADSGFTSVYSGFASDPHGYGRASSMVSSIPVSVNPSLVSLPQYGQSSESISSCNRTIYLGNLHPKTTVEEIANNVRAGGLVESIKPYQNRRVCFITFVDPAIALKFYLSHQVLHQLVIRDSEITVKWGKAHSGPLSRKTAVAVSFGASRNVYIGFRMHRSGPPNLKIPDEATLRKDFSRFGPMEQINHLRKKDCGFMNFLNIADAIDVVECFESRDSARINAIVGDGGEFFEKYRHFKINYGKDRCGNALKFSYVKRNVADDAAPYTPASKPENGSILPDHIDPLDEEAAYVFGISATPVLDRKPSMSSETFAESTMIEEDDIPTPKEQDTGASDSLADNSVPHVTKDVSASRSKMDQKKGHAGSMSKNDINETEEVETDDDDDISIIINADPNESSVPRPKKPAKQKVQKIYHNNLELSDLLNAALNTSADTSLESFSSNHSFSKSSQRGSISSQTSFYRPQPPPLQHMRSYPRGLSFPALPPLLAGSHGNVSPYGSGSQVMADYLARSSHENYMYAAAMLGGNASTESMRDMRRPSRRSFRK